MILAEYLGIPVVTSFAGKGSIPEDHPLCAFYTGFKGSPCGTELSRKADLFLVLRYRFSEWSSSSYVDGVSFKIPPSKVIQVDIDPQEIESHIGDEVVYVLSGNLLVHVENEEGAEECLSLKPGEKALIPSDYRHEYHNHNSDQVRVICAIAPNYEPG